MPRVATAQPHSNHLAVISRVYRQVGASPECDERSEKLELLEKLQAVYQKEIKLGLNLVPPKSAKPQTKPRSPTKKQAKKKKKRRPKKTNV